MDLNSLLTDAEIESVTQGLIDDFLLPKFEELGMDATGQWKNELEPRVNEIWGMDYTEYLVNGRSPGGMPPVDKIEEWVKAKFGYSGNDAKSMAWAVAKSIQQRGTTWYQDGGTDLLNVLHSDECIDWLNDAISKLLAPKLVDEFSTILKTVEWH